MVSTLKKVLKIVPNPVNKEKYILKEYKSPKSKQQIDQEYYQKNKERKKEQRRLRYQQQKEARKNQLAQIYQAHQIKVLLPFKDYINLNKDKQKLWQDFNNLLQDLKTKGIDVIQLMKLQQKTEDLIKDYWKTAKNEEIKGKDNWNNFDYDQQQKFLTYWSQQKFRQENNFLTQLERQEIQSQEYLKELELAKYHEEKGKESCLKGNNPCYSCQTKKEIQKQIAKENKKIITDYEKKQKQEGLNDKEQCPECKKWTKKLNEESRVCFKVSW